jgi:hypothetical protein
MKTYIIPRQFRQIALILLPVIFCMCSEQSIDREAVVKRHCYVLNGLFDITTLGNGEFAFNCDATGLQTFAGNTMSHWAWHSYGLPAGMTPADRIRTTFETHGRVREYLAPWPPDQKDLVRWLYDNPHRMNLGRIAFRGEYGQKIDTADIKIKSRLYNLWKGEVESHFEYQGVHVHVTTVCHPQKDAVSVRVESPLLKNKKIGIALAFPYPVVIQKPQGRSHAPFAGNFLKEDGHATVVEAGTDQISVSRVMDDEGMYHVFVTGMKGLGLTDFPQSTDDLAKKHTLFLYGEDSGVAEFTVLYTNLKATDNASTYDLPKHDIQQIREEARQNLSFEQTREASVAYWASFWQNGGFIDLSGSKDSRWMELERRVILSQFLTAIQSSGSKPPAEAGLYITDGWCSKFHLEMTAWHGAHFVFWGRPHLLDGWTKWYQTIGLPAAKREATAEGWKGAKWLKTPDPYGRWDSWDHGTNRVTQNVHPFYLAELMYRVQPTRETLLAWKDILFETAAMMLDFVYWDASTNRYILGPPVMSGAEGNSGFESWNATSELNYWAMSLRIAKKWRERLDLPKDEKLEHVIAHLSMPPVVNGVYIDAESHPEIWNQTPAGHFLRPAWLEVYGCVNGPLIDPEIMSHTYEKVCEGLRSGEWKGNLWGCDYPMLAMTAARLGKPDEAVDWLLYDAPLNYYSPGGYNAGWYLPGNGGLLWAVALMAAGWDGSEGDTPGFPEDGTWKIKYEGLNKIP